MCARHALPTIEEVEAEIREADEAFALISRAIKLCREHAGGKRGVSGEVACPKCGGALRYSIAASNGHLHGRCKTPGCLQWMM